MIGFFFWVGSYVSQYGSIVCVLYSVLVSLGWDEASVRRRYPPQTRTLSYTHVFRRPDGCWWLHPLRSLPHTRIRQQTVGRRRSVTSQSRAYKRGDCGGVTVHTGSGWETPRVGGACETNDRPCQISRSYPRVGRYAADLLGAGYSPGVVTRGLRVSHVPAFITLTFQFTDAILSAIPACDGMGDSAPNLPERAEAMRHPQPAC